MAVPFVMCGLQKSELQDQLVQRCVKKKEKLKKKKKKGINGTHDLE